MEKDLGERNRVTMNAAHASVERAKRSLTRCTQAHKQARSLIKAGEDRRARSLLTEVPNESEAPLAMRESREKILDLMAREFVEVPLRPYLLLVEAVRQTGGQMRIEPSRLHKVLSGTPPRMEVDATDGPLILRLVD